MAITLRRSGERGRSRYRWLDSYHSFSFADYVDPENTGFSVLRVLNEDRVAPGTGFPSHGHRDMDIVSIVLSGALKHRDNMGNGSTIRCGEVQRMSAGTGVVHSEYNASRQEPLHFLQIWLFPENRGLTPGYEQKTPKPTGVGDWSAIANPGGLDGALSLHQDALLYRGTSTAQIALDYTLRPNRVVYLFTIKGSLTLNENTRLRQGDGAAITNENRIHLQGSNAGDVLLFDLPESETKRSKRI